MAPAPALAAEIREQPANTARAGIARIGWTSDAAGEVVVERRHGLWWVVAASVMPEQHDDGWAARWQPGRETPSGTHRIRLEVDGETLLSDEFEVRPCQCVLPNGLRARWRDGRFRLRLTADYAPAGVGDRRLLAGTVTTGRPVVRVLRDGRRIGSVRLRYREGAFRGTWRAPRRSRASVVFSLVSLTDGFGNT